MVSFRTYCVGADFKPCSINL